MKLMLKMIANFQDYKQTYGVNSPNRSLMRCGWAWEAKKQSQWCPALAID